MCSPYVQTYAAAAISALRISCLSLATVPIPRPTALAIFTCALDLHLAAEALLNLAMLRDEMALLLNLILGAL